MTSSLWSLRSPPTQLIARLDLQEEVAGRAVVVVTVAAVATAVVASADCRQSAWLARPSVAAAAVAGVDREDLAGLVVDIALVVGVGQAGGPAVATVPEAGGEPAALEDPVVSGGVAAAGGGAAGDPVMEDPVVLAGVVTVGGAAAADPVALAEVVAVGWAAAVSEAALTAAEVDGTRV
ncbi:hypothetical protein MSG28_006261 [Choristoneura fumiferana]|uniref:Uncharacterized protein n=1 Tax=Choristoneura fumiferana TaxID=7141 RepID=A0ACC0JE59_CHOFU|nr:hypothetical protein MSG28_006261 [Choristoneura fumiferana]